jgi:hypothetical protein
MIRVCRGMRNYQLGRCIAEEQGKNRDFFSQPAFSGQIRKILQYSVVNNPTLVKRRSVSSLLCGEATHCCSPDRHVGHRAKVERGLPVPPTPNHKSATLTARRTIPELGISSLQTCHHLHVADFSFTRMGYPLSPCPISLRGTDPHVAICITSELRQLTKEPTKL